MKLLTLALLLTSLNVNARTQPIFAADGSKATVMILGGGDTDAKKMFDLLTAPVENFNGKLSKKMAFDSATTGKRILSIVCVFSAVIADNGTCTLVLNSSEFSVVNKNLNEALLNILENPAEAQRLAREFAANAYASNDGRLRFETQPGFFNLEYR